MAREQPQQRWSLLRSRHRTRGIVLALGAGLSAGCGLPNWPELLMRVGECCLPRRGRELVQELLAAGATLPAIAGILESRSPRRRSYSDVLRDALYRDFPFHQAITTGSARSQLVRFVREHSPTMQAVAALCAERNGKDGLFQPNPRIRAVVNFNLDSVLRTYAAARYDTFLFRTIERADKPQRLGRIPIYHMHGLLRFDRRQHEHEDEQELRAVFTEGEYFDVFNQPHSVFNYTFLYLLREFNCLFIGLSMNDENIRRLLHYSTAERRGQLGRREVDSRIALRHFAILRHGPSREVEELIEISLRRLGTRVLWIRDFDELPARLATVYGSGWSGVF
jgi:hypothetical protein